MSSCTAQVCQPLAAPLAPANFEAIVGTRGLGPMANPLVTEQWALAAGKETKAGKKPSKKGGETKLKPESETNVPNKRRVDKDPGDAPKDPQPEKPQYGAMRYVGRGHVAIVKTMGQSKKRNQIKQAPTSF